MNLVNIFLSGKKKPNKKKEKKKTTKGHCTTRKSTNTNGIIEGFFHRYFGVIFTDQILSIANSVSIYRHKYFVSIYRGNASRNRRNLKKPNSMMMCKFLLMILPIKL